MPDPKKTTALKAANGVPEPLRPLGDEGGKTWARIWTSGAAWIAVTTDIETVQLLCEAIDERAALRPVVLTGEADWRDRVALRNLEHAIHSMLASIGFTPADRTRLGVGEVRKESTLERLRSAK